jgi:hypothetical protein
MNRTTGEKMLPGAEEDRGNSNMHLVHQSCTKVLPDRSGPAAEPDVFAAPSVGGSLECSVDTFGNKVEGGAAVHGDRRSWVIGEYEDGSVVRWIVAPPSLPGVVRPRSSNRPEHVAAQDPRPNVAEPTRREVVINAGRASVTAKHLSKCTGGKGPFVQRNATDSKWIVDVLFGACAKAINRNGEAVDTESGRHWCAHQKRGKGHTV